MLGELLAELGEQPVAGASLGQVIGKARVVHGLKRGSGASEAWLGFWCRWSSGWERSLWSFIEQPVAAASVYFC